MMITTLKQKKDIQTSDINFIWKFQVAPLADFNGRVTPEMQQLLTTIENELEEQLDQAPAAALRFQTMVAEHGAKTRRRLMMPEGQTPYWLRDPHPFENFQSTAALATEADIVVIGLGLTGVSAAYHLIDQLHLGKKIVCLDAFDPGTQSSGKNGGNFELIPENFKDNYEGLVREREKFIQTTEPELSNKEIKTKAQKEAKAILQIGVMNGQLLVDIVEKEGIAADLSRAGWLRVAESLSEEKSLQEEVIFANEHAVSMEFLTPAQIKTQFGIKSQFGGRLAPGFGNYHPFKFINGVVQKLIAEGIKIYTRTKVKKIDNSQLDLLIQTDKGNIQTKKVIVATNAFTAELFPELKGIVQPYVSQIFNMEHVATSLINERTLESITFTRKFGDIYANIPKGSIYRDQHGTPRGTAHVGGGLDRPIEDPYCAERSQEILDQVKLDADILFPTTENQPPSHVWAGPMAFTKDRLPLLGYLNSNDKRILLAVGFNGYGGTWTLWSGRKIAKIAAGNETLDPFLESIFSASRMTTSKLSMT